MSNLINNNFQNVKLILDKEDYWDFYIHKDGETSFSFNKKSIYKEGLICYIDLSNYDCIVDDEIVGLDEYTWSCAHNNGKIFTNIGYTGFDNGLLKFRRDRITNKDFLELYQNSIYEIQDGVTLKLRPVSGSTNNFQYPITVQDFDIKLNGGFYQGFFKTQYGEYQILPSTIQNGETWGFEFVLNKMDFEREGNKILNDKYPNNKGIFFYIGTRAENKWDYLYSEKQDECFAIDLSDYVEDAEIDMKTFRLTAFTNMNDSCEECEIFDDIMIEEKQEEFDYDYIENDLDISEAIYSTKDGFALDKKEEYFETDNKFLLFDRTCDGLNVNNYEEGTVVRYVTQKNSFKENLFLLMNRTCTGKTINDIENLKEQYTIDYDVVSDLYNNALAFRIKDDGSIGYRYLIKNCNNEEKYEIKEAYSKPNIIINGEWCSIHVKIESFSNKMKIKFYVNGNLVFISDELPLLDLRELNDLTEKQETVPYNISLGGGTQGLIETVLPNYMNDPYRVYPLEENFAGSFIGYIKSFKFYTSNLESINISNNFNAEMDNLIII